MDASTTAFQVDLLTAMQNRSENGWVVAGSFTSAVTANSAQKLNVTGLLKYVRWRVTTITAGTAITFVIHGMGRTN